MDMIVVLCMVPDAGKAADMGHALVTEKLAACMNVVPGARSIYAWQGKVHDEPEVLCLIKARASDFEVVRARIEELHPYEVPEIVALAPTACHQPYLQWLTEMTGR